MGRLPTQMQVILATRTEDHLDDVAEQTDRIHEVSYRAVVAATSKTADKNLEKMVEDLTKKVEELSVKIEKNRARSRSRSRSRAKEQEGVITIRSLRKRQRNANNLVNFRKTRKAVTEVGR